MEVTGNGEVKGIESAQVSAPWNGPRQDWAANASMRKGHVSQGHYMGETNLVGDLSKDNEPKINPDIFYRAEGVADGSIKHGKFPV